jgi:hypothetical protein
MSISIIDARCYTSILNSQMDFFYRLNENISRRVAIGWIAIVRLVSLRPPFG